MCKPASFIITKDSVFWSRFTDSHEDIISEFGLHPDGAKGPNIVRVEITPPDDDVDRPASEWNFQVDQDILPKWWDAEDGEKRGRVALDEWIAANVISNDRAEPVRQGRVFIVGHATIKAGGNATVKVGGNATVEAWGNATVEAWGNATVKAWDRATVKAGHKSTIIRWSNNAAVTLADEAVLVDRSGDKPVCRVEK